MVRLNRKSLNGVVTLCCFILLSSLLALPAQASTTKNMLDDYEEYVDDNFGHYFDDGVYYCSFPESDRSENLTREEMNRRLRMPWCTPEQVTIQDEEDNGGQRSGNPRPIKALVIIDAEAENFYYNWCEQEFGWDSWFYYYYANWENCQNWANNVLEYGDNPLESPYGINYEIYRIERWNSPNLSFWNMLAQARGNFTKANYGYNVLVVMTGRSDPDLYGVADSFNDCFVMDMKCAGSSPPLDNLFQHEASHMFGCSDIGHTSTCVMHKYDTPNHRIYCDVCDSKLWANRFKYDAGPSYATSATPFTSAISAYVNNKNNILGAPDGNYAELYSGTFGNKAVITVDLSNAPVSGTLKVICRTPSGNGANIIVSIHNQYGWYQFVQTNLYPPNTVITLSGYVTYIDQVSITAYHQYNGYPSNIFVDAVVVE